jgi:hypothetical protein
LDFEGCEELCIKGLRYGIYGHGVLDAGVTREYAMALGDTAGLRGPTINEL